MRIVKTYNSQWKFWIMSDIITVKDHPVVKVNRNISDYFLGNWLSYIQGVNLHLPVLNEKFYGFLALFWYGNIRLSLVFEINLLMIEHTKGCKRNKLTKDLFQ